MRIETPLVIIVKQENDVPEYAVYERTTTMEKKGSKMVPVEKDVVVVRPMAINTMFAHLQRWLVHRVFNYDQTKPAA